MFVELTFVVLAIVLFFGFFGEVIFAKTKIPDVIWLLLLGILMGSVFRIISADAFASIAPFFTTFALIFLLFEAGINTDIRQFIQTAPKGLLLTFLSFILAAAVVTGIGFALGLNITLALLLGAMLGGISSAVVIPVLKGADLEEKTKLSLMFDSAFSDVLCILATVTIVDVAVIGQAVNGLALIKDVLASFLIAIAIGVIAAGIWNTTLRPRINKHLLVLTLAFMLLVYALTQLIGANGAIACLVFGLILGNTQKIQRFLESEEKQVAQKTGVKSLAKKTAAQLKKEKEQKQVITTVSKEVYGELAFAIKTFFFVYLGLLLDFTSPVSFVYAFIIVVGLYVARPFAVAATFGKSTKLSDAVVMSTLIPKGLAAAVLVQYVIQSGVVGADILVNIVLAVILLSIVSSTIFMVVVQRNPKFKGFVPFLFRKYRR